MGAGRAFATPRGGGGRYAANPCARRSAAVRAVGSAALLRRCRGRGPFGASLPARPRPRLVSGRPARAPAAGAPCSGLGATHSPAVASGGYGTAPTPPPPRRSGRTAPRTDPPRRSGRTANGRTPAGAADGPRRAERPDPTDRLPTATRGQRAARPTDRLPTNERGARADRPPADRNAMAARVRTDRPPADQRTRREGRTADLRPRCSLVPRSLRARSSLAARCARRGAERSDSPEGAARGEAPHTPSGLMGRMARAERGYKKTYLGVRRWGAS